MLGSQSHFAASTVAPRFALKIVPLILGRTSIGASFMMVQHFVQIHVLSTLDSEKNIALCMEGRRYALQHAKTTLGEIRLDALNTVAVNSALLRVPQMQESRKHYVTCTVVRACVLLRAPLTQAKAKDIVQSMEEKRCVQIPAQSMRARKRCGALVGAAVSNYAFVVELQSSRKEEACAGRVPQSPATKRGSVRRGWLLLWRIGPRKVSSLHTTPGTR